MNSYTSSLETLSKKWKMILIISYHSFYFKIKNQELIGWDRNTSYLINGFVIYPINNKSSYSMMTCDFEFILYVLFLCTCSLKRKVV